MSLYISDSAESSSSNLFYMETITDTGNTITSLERAIFSYNLYFPAKSLLFAMDEQVPLCCAHKKVSLKMMYSTLLW